MSQAGLAHAWLAQAPVVEPASDVLFQVVVAGGVLLAACVVGYVAIGYAKRRANPQDDLMAKGPFWSLSELRQLRDQGQISEVEFELLKNRTIRDARRQPARSASADGDLALLAAAAEMDGPPKPAPGVAYAPSPEASPPAPEAHVVDVSPTSAPADAS